MAKSQIKPFADTRTTKFLSSPNLCKTRTQSNIQNKPNHFLIPNKPLKAD